MKNGDWKSEIEDNKRFREIGSKNVKQRNDVYVGIKKQNKL
jgi:hypothetical protein